MQDRPLAEVEDHQLYRKRNLSETELVTARQTELVDNSSSRSYEHISSARTRSLAKIRFHNASQQHVRPLWVDFDGHEVTLHMHNAVHHRCKVVTATADASCSAGGLLYLEAWRN